MYCSRLHGQSQGKQASKNVQSNSSQADYYKVFYGINNVINVFKSECDSDTFKKYVNTFS